jgi:DNA-binding transcriptional ArsR family regulator
MSETSGTNRAAKPRAGKSDTGRRRQRPAFARDAEDHEDLVDPKAMRALTHPVRLRLLQALMLDGPLTATQAAERIGETPTTCSFHFRQLRKYGFVEDDAEPGGRERPWRLAGMNRRIPSRTGDPDADLAAAATIKMLLEHYIAEMRAWWQRILSYPSDWQSATGLTDMVMFVTPAELTELRGQLDPMLYRYMDRLEDPSLRPPGARPVRTLIIAYPVESAVPGLDAAP